MDVTPGYAKRWIGLVFIGISLLVISLDNTVLNVALPAISTQLGASASQLQWILDAYVLVFAALLLTMGSIGDRLGRKRALQFGLVMFGIGSLWAALSNSTEMLIASRAFLGIGGATIMPATLSIISATFPPKERSQAIAIWAAVFGLGVGIGPVVGGLLLKYYDWNSVFFINLPVIVIALIGGYFFLAESNDPDAPKPDVPGVILSIVGLFALVYAIIEAGLDGWTADHVLAAFGVAFVMLAAFAWWENRNPNAMLPLYFFRNMSFTGANTALAFVMFSLFGSLFFMGQYLQTIKGYSPLEAGVRMVPLAVTLAFMAAMSARISNKLGIKWTVALGIFVAACGLLFMSLFYETDTSYGVIILGQIILAMGMGTAVSPATNSIMSAVPVNKAGIGSAMNDTTRQLGGAFGIAVLGTIMNSRYLEGIRSLKAELPGDLYNGVSSSIQAAHIISHNPNLPESVRASIWHTADKAFVSGMNEAMLIGAVIMFVASLFAVLVVPSEVHRTEEESPQEFEKPKRRTEEIEVPALGDR
jgi:EmrB/QacA subfamily drug resistance transporter